MMRIAGPFEMFFIYAQTGMEEFFTQRIARRNAERVRSLAQRLRYQLVARRYGMRRTEVAPGVFRLVPLEKTPQPPFVSSLPSGRADAIIFSDGNSESGRVRL